MSVGVAILIVEGVMKMEKSVREVWFSAEAVAERRALWEAKVAREQKGKQAFEKFVGQFKKVFKLA
jgi:hypothetical protein